MSFGAWRFFSMLNILSRTGAVRRNRAQRAECSLSKIIPGMNCGRAAAAARNRAWAMSVMSNPQLCTHTSPSVCCYAMGNSVCH